MTTAEEGEFHHIRSVAELCQEYCESLPAPEALLQPPPNHHLFRPSGASAAIANTLADGRSTAWLCHDCHARHHADHPAAERDDVTVDPTPAPTPLHDWWAILTLGGRAGFLPPVQYLDTEPSPDLRSALEGMLPPLPSVLNRSAVVLAIAIAFAYLAPRAVPAGMTAPSLPPSPPDSPNPSRSPSPTAVPDESPQSPAASPVYSRSPSVRSLSPRSPRPATPETASGLRIITIDPPSPSPTSTLVASLADALRAILALQPAYSLPSTASKGHTKRFRVADAACESDWRVLVPDALSSFEVVCLAYLLNETSAASAFPFTVSDWAPLKHGDRPVEIPGRTAAVLALRAELARARGDHPSCYYPVRAFALAVRLARHGDPPPPPPGLSRVSDAAPTESPPPSAPPSPPSSPSTSRLASPVSSRSSSSSGVAVAPLPGVTDPPPPSPPRRPLPSHPLPRCPWWRVTPSRPGRRRPPS